VTTLPTMLALGIALGAAAAPAEVSGIPYFARKYNFTCAQCHVAPPKLNQFGQQFLERGYALLDCEPDRVARAGEVHVQVRQERRRGAVARPVLQPRAEARQAVREDLAFQRPPAPQRRLTRLIAGIFAAVTVSDFLHRAYEAAAAGSEAAAGGRGGAAGRPARRAA
jgi:hypothetical protein